MAILHYNLIEDYISFPLHPFIESLLIFENPFANKLMFNLLFIFHSFSVVKNNLRSLFCYVLIVLRTFVTFMLLIKATLMSMLFLL